MPKNCCSKYFKRIIFMIMISQLTQNIRKYMIFWPHVENPQNICLKKQDYEVSTLENGINFAGERNKTI